MQILNFRLKIGLKKDLIRRSKNNLEKSSKAKVGKPIFCGYSVPTIWTLDGIENKHDEYRGEDCIEKHLIMNH